MSSYTMPLRVLVEQPTQYETGLTFDEKVEIGRKKLFSFSYPQLNDKFKKEFETNFIHHFYTREIGFETEELFKLKLRTWLNMHMPYWVKMLETDDLIKEPLVNVNWTRTLDTKKDTDQKSTSSGKQTSSTEDKASQSGNSTDITSATNESFERDVRSDTPESRLQLSTGSEGTGIIEYANSIEERKSNSEGSSTNSNKTSSEGSGTSKGSSDTSAKGETDINEVGSEKETTKGNMGMKTESEMIQLYRDILMKWQPMIFKEMEQLFMLVY